MSEDLEKFILKISSFISFEEFKFHLTSYLKFQSEEDVLKYIESGDAKSVFVDTSPWYKRKAHQAIIEVVKNLFIYYTIHRELPFSSQQALSDVKRDYMDIEKLNKILAVSRTWVN